MKKIVLMLFVMISSSVAIAFAFKGEENKVPNKEIKVNVWVSFGNPSKSGCPGSGFCDWGIGIEWSRIASDSKMGGGTVSLRDSAGGVVLSLDKSRMSKEASTKYLSSGYFVVENDFVIPADVAKQLGSRVSPTIKAGQYKVETKGDIMTINF